jgi:uncharacterized ion transporter superfamily protein YfcC
MTTTKEIKIGDFIKSSFKYLPVCGIVTGIKKSIIIIKKCHPHYEEYKITDTLLNITKSKIYQVGLLDNERIIN